MREERTYDCIVIGAGPAGLTAAIYLARFLLNILVIDGGDSRAALIPKTRNHAGYPGGIAGTELLRLMREQAESFGVKVIAATAGRLAREGDRFEVGSGAGSFTARSVLLATGVVNNRPPMDDAAHDEALARGLIRYCPICDGYEVRDKNIAVYGDGWRGAKEALFLRMFSADVTLIETGGETIASECRAKLEAARVPVVAGPVRSIAAQGDQIAVALAAETLTFDTLYPALGSVIRSHLAKQVDADMSDEGCLVVDTHQRTSVAGLYAAGDVVQGLDQISHAMGEGGVAATTIRNDLAERAPLLRG